MVEARIFFQAAGVNINSCLDFPRVCIIGYATFQHNVSTATRFRELMRALCFATFLKSGNHMSYRVESLGPVQFTLSKNAQLSLQTLCIAATSPGRHKDQRHPRQLLKNVTQSILWYSTGKESIENMEYVLVFEKIDLEDLSSTLELRRLSTDHSTMLLNFHSDYLKISEDKARAVYRRRVIFSLL